MEKVHFVCEKEDRLDKVLYRYFEQRGYSRNNIKEFIKKGFVVLNDKIVSKASTKVLYGDKIEVVIPKDKGIEPIEGDLDVIYEDEYLLVINKPPNLTTHPAPSCKEPTLVNILIKRYPELKTLDKERPGIVHRLDKDTSGLMIIAKNKDVQEKLKSMFQKREIKKKYIVLVHNILRERQGEINVLMDRDHISRTKMKVYKDRGRESITRYKVITDDLNYNVSLVEAELLTGRTHQIRVHFSHIGHPVVGDKLYGRPKKIDNLIIKKLAKRQMLHSWYLDFIHPVTKKRLWFKVPVPEDFFRVILYISKKRPMCVAVTGGVGCGKSKVSELLSKGGYPLWSADQAVEELYKAGGAGFEHIRLNFGDKYIDPQKGCINKKKLFETMSQDQYFRQQVERIIHPLVFEHMVNFIEMNKSKNMVILEIPLLVEAGWTKENYRGMFDIIVGIFCAENVRNNRLKEIRGWNEEKIKQTIKWQASQRERVMVCDIIIDNSKSLDELQKKVATIKILLRKLRIKRLFKKLTKLRELGIIDWVYKNEISLTK